MGDETAEYTPGPWKVERRSNYPNPDMIALLEESPDRALRVVTVDGTHDAAARREANARLIAAAPDLLAAAEAVSDAVGDATESGWDPHLVQDVMNAVGRHLRPAIAKARGEADAD